MAHPRGPLPGSWSPTPAEGAERAFYGSDARRVTPGSYEEVSEVVGCAEASGVPLIPAGRGSHAYLGNPPPLGPPPLVLSLEGLDAVVQYEPGDFTISVQAGLRLRDLRALLAEKGQEVAADFSQASGGTVGGLVAAAVPGPRRGRHGPLRSQVIGMRAVRGGGRLYRTGGMVVKNVAGYEIAKLLTGSLGTAGPVLEVNFKLRPLPEVERGGLAFTRGPGEAARLLARLRRDLPEPAALALLEPGAGARLAREARLDLSREGPGEETWTVLWVLEGNRAAVSWLEGEAERLTREESGERPAGCFDPARAVLDFLCELGEPADPTGTTEAVVRASVLPARAPAVVEAAAGLFRRWSHLSLEGAADAGGLVTLRWRGEEEALEAPLVGLVEAVCREGGVAWLVYLPPARRRRWPYLLSGVPNRTLAERILRVFDPCGLFCPGRILGAAGERGEG